MNMNGIYANKATDASTIAKAAEKEESSNASYEKGQVIEGIISKVSDQISINFSGREYEFSKETVQNATEGEIRKFEIMDVSRKGIVLKEVGNTAVGSKNTGSKTSTAMIIADSFAMFQSKTEEGTAAGEELSDVSNRMTGEDYEDLNKEGYTVEDLNLERLDLAITRIKEQRAFKEESIVRQVVKKQDNREQVEEAARNMATDHPESEMAAEKLEELGLPPTKENLESMLSTMELAKQANQITDAGCAYLIGNDLEPTAANIYRAIHSRASESNNLSDEVWNEIKDEVASRVTDEGFQADNETMQNARWLVKNDLAVTGKNLKYKQFLDQAREDDSLNFALHLAAAEMVNGSNIVQSFESETQKSDVIHLVHDIRSVTDEDVELAYRNKKENTETGETENRKNTELTIRDLLNAKQEREESDQNQNSQNQSNETTEYNQNDIALITSKRQLEEIRLRLTAESGAKMLAKGIRIDTEALSKIVDELKEMEASYYKNLAAETGLSGEEQISLLQETNTRIEQLKEAPSVILGRTFQNRDLQTIESLLVEGNSYEAKFKLAGESYETLMTKPRADLGDSIKKAFEHIDEMLEHMDMETTRANERAVRILSYNSMEITEENINTMKAYDAKVNELFENLSPPVTAALIKDGVNPLKMPIDELTKKASEIREENGETAEKSFSEYLIQLEDKKELTQDERNSYIGIYRLLHQVEKTDGAAIGSLVKSGQEVTLNNLLRAVRTRKHGELDASIDDSFGALESVKKQGTSITDQISSAFNSEKSQSTLESSNIKEQEDYQSWLLSKVGKDLSPDKLSQLTEQYGDSLMDTDLEQLKEQLETMESEDHTRADQHLKDIQELSRDCREEQQFLREYEIPDSIHNIMAAKELSENGTVLFQERRKLSEKLNGDAQAVIEREQDILDSVDDPEQLQEQYDLLQKETEELLDRTMESENLTVEDLKRMSIVRETLGLTLSLSKKEYYNIPVETDRGTMALNLTVVHEEGVSGRASMRVPTTEGKEVRAELQMTEQGIKCFITTESRIDTEQLKQTEDVLIQNLNALGYEVRELFFDTTSNDNTGFIFKNGSIYKTSREQEDESFGQKEQESGSVTRTGELYKAAKTIIQYIRKM